MDDTMNTIPGEMGIDDGTMADMDYNYSMEVNGMPVDGVDPAVATAGFAVAGVFMIIYIGIIILMIMSMWKIFKKAKQPGWASIIPIYNIIVILQIVNKPLWWIILMFIPFVNIVVLIMVLHELSKAFGKSVGFTLGLTLLGIIFFPILAFGDAQYVESGAEEDEMNTPPQDSNFVQNSQPKQQMPSQDVDLDM